LASSALKWAFISLVIPNVSLSCSDHIARKERRS
jgi:hypothetical protein